MLLKAMLDYVKARYSTRSLDEKGQGVVEYALILAFVVAVAVALVGTDGIQAAIQTTFGNVSTTLNDANQTQSGGQGGQQGS